MCSEIWARERGRARSEEKAWPTTMCLNPGGASHVTRPLDGCSMHCGGWHAKTRLTSRLSIE